MDKIYSAQDVANVIAKVEELAVLNAELEELLYCGSNDEKLVEIKRELQSQLKKFKYNLPNHDPRGFVQEAEDEDLASLKADYEFVVSRYKGRKLRLEAEISIYKNGN